MISKKNDLTHGSILKGFIGFSLPLFAGSLFQQLYGTVDIMFVGNYLGKTDAAAVGASSILLTCLIGLFTGIAVGAGVIAAQQWGAGQVEKVKTVCRNSLWMGMVCSILLTVLGQVFARQALRLLNTPEKIMEHALIYLRIYFLSILPMILYNLTAAMLRAMGDSKSPFVVLAIGGFLNVAMDALFLAVLQKGVEGAAAATLVSQSFTAISLSVLLFRRTQLWSGSWKINWRLLGKIIRIGVPLGVQSMIITLSNLFVQYYINGFGADAVAAFTIYFRAENLLYLPIMAFGQAMVTFTGQNIGASQYRRIRKGAVSFNLFSVLVILIASVFLLMCGYPILKLFCQDEDVIVQGVEIISVTFPFYFLYAILEVTGGIVRGMGKTIQSMGIIVGSMCVVRLTLLSYVVDHYHTIPAIAAVYPLTWGVAAAGFVCYYCVIRKRWFPVQ